MKPLHRPALRVQRTLRCLVVTAFLGAAAAQANDHAAIAELLRQNQPAEALTQIERQMMSTPQDPQLRFLKGVAQAMSNQSQDAIDTFTRLTQEYPELPEPYNNLAVLYANQNQLDKSRQALEQAIRTNPSYSTAHENLGDIYAKLASQAYSKALQLDGHNAESLQPKLSLIHSLFSTTPGAAPAAAAAPTQVAAAAPARPAFEPPAPAPGAAVVPAGPAAAPAPAPAPAAPKAPATVAEAAKPAPQPAPSQPAAAASQAVEAAVQQWAKAWAAKNMSGYLGAYSPNFRPAGGQSRAAWEKERHARIVGRRSITVQVSDLKVSVNGQKATARFYQQYRADSLRANTRKTLQFEQRQGRWLIVGESTGG